MTKPTFIDSHCHIDLLDLAPYDNNIENLMTAITNNGVSHMLCVSVDLDRWDNMAKLVAPYDNVSLSVGVHPGAVPANIPAYSESFAPMLTNPKVIAIGETGLDYHYSTEHKLAQQASFITQIDIAKTHRKPLIIHTRDARLDTINILTHENARDIGGILHCFTENWEMAKKGLDLGFYISFSGIITFKNAEELREVVAKTPMDRILIETDAPYLTPVPYRGKPNQPGLVPFVAKTIAEVKGLSIEEVAHISSQNFRTLFHENLTSFA